MAFVPQEGHGPFKEMTGATDRMPRCESCKGPASCPGHSPLGWQSVSPPVRRLLPPQSVHFLKPWDSSSEQRTPVAPDFMTVVALLGALVGGGAGHVLSWRSDVTVFPGPAPVARAQDPTLGSPTWVYFTVNCGA